MAVSTTQEFFDLLAKSEVLSAAKLVDARREAESAPDPKAAARELVRLNLLTKWQAGVLVGGRSTLKLGKYTLLEQIGSEEIGLVYLAEHVQMGRRVVIKTLSNKHTNNADAVKRFLSEAQRIAALHHRNIIHLFDVSSEQERYYIVLEHVEGKDFQSLVSSGGALDRELAADYLIQAAEGLAHAHAKGLYHGDIKAENLLVDSQGQVKILNFGVARLVDESAKPADAASDLRALGEVGTFLLTGKTGLGDRKSAPPGLESLCLKMTTTSDAERFASAEEAAAALKKWLAEQKAAGPSAAPKIARTAAAPVAKAEPAKSKPKPPALVKRGEKIAASGAAAAVASAVAVAEAESEPDPFRINIDTSGRSKVAEKPKAAPAPSAATEDQPAEVGAEPAVEKKLPLVLLIGGGAGAGIAAMLLLGLGIWFFWPPGNEEVAQVDEPVETAPVDPDEGLKNPEPKVEEPAPEPEKPADPAIAPEPMPEPPKPEPAKPDPPPPVEPVKPEPPKPEPAPPPTPKPEPQKNPFTDLGLAVDLPKLGTAEAPEAEATTPVALGSLHVQPKDLFFVDLAGGDKAANKGKQTYSIKAAKGGTADRDWEVSVSDGGPASVIATLSAKDDKLNFQWTDKAVADPASANQLRNCVLTSRTGAFTHALAFRKPIEATPITVTFEKPMRADLTMDFLPDSGSIEIEVTSLEGPFPKHKFDPKATFEAAATGKNKDSVAILLGKEKEESLILKVESQLQKKLTVTVSPYFRLAVQPKETKLTTKAWKDAVAFVGVQNATLFNAVDQANKVKNPTPQQQQFKSQAEQTLAKFQEAVKQIDEMNATHTAINNTGKIHYRVYFRAGEQTVDLARTSAAPAAAPQAGK